MSSSHSRYPPDVKPNLSFGEICALGGQQLYEGALEHPLVIVTTAVVVITLARVFFPRTVVPILNWLQWLVMLPLAVVLDVFVVPVLRFINLRLAETSGGGKDVRFKDGGSSGMRSEKLSSAAPEPSS